MDCSAWLRNIYIYIVDVRETRKQIIDSDLDMVNKTLFSVFT